MIAIDTNIVVRYLTNDHPGQATLRGFDGLPPVTLEDPGLAAQALDWMEAGLDFADALHLAKAAGCDAFVTFDQRFVQAAGRLGAIKVRIP
jgi:predicted nucleic acid-binding protein